MYNGGGCDRGGYGGRWPKETGARAGNPGSRKGGDASWKPELFKYTAIGIYRLSYGRSGCNDPKSRHFLLRSRYYVGESEKLLTRALALLQRREPSLSGLLGTRSAKGRGWPLRKIGPAAPGQRYPRCTELVVSLL